MIAYEAGRVAMATAVGMLVVTTPSPVLHAVYAPTAAEVVAVEYLAAWDAVKS